MIEPTRQQIVDALEQDLECVHPTSPRGQEMALSYTMIPVWDAAEIVMALLEERAPLTRWGDHR